MLGDLPLRFGNLLLERVLLVGKGFGGRFGGQSLRPLHIKRATRLPGDAVVGDGNGALLAELTETRFKLGNLIADLMVLLV